MFNPRVLQAVGISSLVVIALGLALAAFQAMRERSGRAEALAEENRRLSLALQESSGGSAVAEGVRRADPSAALEKDWPLPSTDQEMNESARQIWWIAYKDTNTPKA